MIRRFAGLLALALVMVAAPLMAAELAPGEKAPDVKGLVCTDGKACDLGDMKDAKAVVLCFTCNICPVSVAYEDRFIDFTKKYEGKGVKFVAINANKKTEDLAAMKARAEEKGFNFPYVFDKSGTSATQFGAARTPTLYVLDDNGVIQYVGAFDNDMKNPTKHYVADAVDAVLAGKTPAVAKTKAVGCGIQNK